MGVVDRKMQAEDFVPFLPRKYGIILSGSFAELPLLYSLSNITDIDMMMEDKMLLQSKMMHAHRDVMSGMLGKE